MSPCTFIGNISMPRKRRRHRTLPDILLAGSGNQNLLVGLVFILPLFAIPVIFHRLDGNQFQAALIPFAKAGALFFGVGSLLFLLVAAVRYWQEWQEQASN
jgi:hypothetical protein